MSCTRHKVDVSMLQPITVNGAAIARETIAREAQHHPAAAPGAAFEAAARALVIRELLLQEARRAKVEAVPLCDDAGRREAEDEALIRCLIEQEIETPDPSEADCRRYYDQNKRLFRSSTIYEAAHILLPVHPGDTDSLENVRREAEEILAELKQRPEQFAELARLHSACPSAAQGGNLGQVTAGQTAPEFEQALLQLEPGNVCEEPVATRYGFHIIRLDRKIEGRELSFDLVAERIAEYLSESVARRATAQYIARLVSRADIRGIAIEGAEAHRVS